MTLSWLPGYGELFRLCEGCRCSFAPTRSFEALALDTLGIAFQMESDAAGIPAAGPLIVAANHPTGIADGLVLIEAIRRTRRDVRIMANHLLACIPEMRDVCFFVDPFGGNAAARRSLAGLRATHTWLRRGGCVVLFPAGEVAWTRRSNSHGSFQTPVDSIWSPTLGRLALATGAQVIPAFIAGRNSTFFYAAGRIHRRLRTLLLARELLRHRGTTFSIRFGTALPADRIAASSGSDVTRLARHEADALAAAPTGKVFPIPAARPAHLLCREVASLPAGARLLTSGSYDVFCADSALIPNVLDEIGRLREVTFRAAGEGTGRGRDIDRFDFSYQHLFVWDRTRSEIVGAYRIGATDRILPASGVEGLYTSTLFKYDGRLLGQITPALELGRSFVRQEYQRSHSALLLLWKGIGELVARSPRYRILFGAVSISNNYQSTSKALIRSFLSQYHASDLTALVHGVNPPLPIVPLQQDLPVVAHVDNLEQAIRTIETDRGIPVLLRHYLRLNATLLGFNVDRLFGDALDALMMVDLASLPAVVLRKYLARDNAQAFLDYHGGRHTTPQRAA
jgi:putative hemolysin